jgi:hypothetical protein
MYKRLVVHHRLTAIAADWAPSQREVATGHVALAAVLLLLQLGCARVRFHKPIL